MTMWEDEPSKIRVGIQENGYLFATNAVAVYMALRYDQEHGAMVHIEEDGTFSLNPYDGLVVSKPTMTLPREFAYALHMALTRHFQGEGDNKTIRADLLHERERVDRLITVVSDALDKLVDQ